MKRFISILLVCVLLFSLCSCSNTISYIGMKTLYEIEPSDTMILAYLVACSFEQNNMEDVRKYGEDFLLCSEEQKKANLQGLEKVLVEGYGVIENKEKQLAKLYDTITMYYTLCSLFDDKGNVVNFCEILPSYLECCNLLLQGFEQASVDFASVIPQCELSEDELKTYFSFLHYSLPYVDSEQAFCTAAFLNVMYNKFTDIEGTKFFWMADYLVSGQTHDNNLAQQINVSIASNTNNKTRVSLDATKSYFENLQLPVDVRECAAFFGVLPTSKASNAIFLYETNEYNIVFYGVPSNTVEIVDKVTGKILYERFVSQ